MMLWLQSCQRQVVIKMLREMNRDRYKALQLLADHLRTPSKDLSLDAIFNDVKEDEVELVSLMD